MRRAVLLALACSPALALAACSGPAPAPVTVAVPPSAPAATGAPAAAPAPCPSTCQGEGTPELVQALREAAQKASGCYKEQLRAGDAAGVALVSVQVDALGAVCRVEAKLDAALAPMEACLRARFEGLKLPAPRGGCLKANIPIHFATNDEPPAELPSSAVVEVVARNREAVSRRCWKPALAAHPASAPSARVSAALSIEPSGSVGTASAAGAEKEFPGLAACVEAELKTWTFPAAGGTTKVQIPFSFSGP
jgi:hypothetical protein